MSDRTPAREGHRTRDPIPPIVVMGVSGSGKTTVGSALAERLGVPFLDADDLHPPHNREKMRAGVPLTDADREPWLDAVGDRLAARSPAGAVTSCSALHRRYRDRLRARAPGTVFVHLDGDRATIADRLAARSGHFMPASLLDSQLAALEPLAPDEDGVTLELSRGVPELVDAAAAWLARR